jgi:hypothetical protein
MQQRTLIHVEPDVSGWLVALLGKPIEYHTTKLAAIGAADRIAASRFAGTGEPTAVSVRLQSGEALQIGRWG